MNKLIKDSKEELLDFCPLTHALQVKLGHATHTLTYGRSPHGRDKQLLTYAQLLLQDKQLKAGGTFIVETPRLGSTLYNLAKSLGRKKIMWLNPYLHLGVRNQLMWMDAYSEEEMDKWVVDYQKAIRNGYLVIIDLEPLKYHHRYDFAVSLVLWHLRMKLDKLFARDRLPHVLFVENTKRHMKDLIFFLEYGHCYDLSCYLWADSPSQFQLNHNYLPLIEMTIGHTFLNTRHAISDYAYYIQLFNEIPFDLLKESPYINATLYRVLDKGHEFYQGVFLAQMMEEEEFKRFRNNGKKTMTQLINESTKQEAAQTHLLETSESEDDLSLLHALEMSKEVIIPKHEKEQSLEQLQTEALSHRHKRLIDMSDWGELDW